MLSIFGVDLMISRLGILWLASSVPRKDASRSMNEAGFTECHLEPVVIRLGIVVCATLAILSLGATLVVP